jgi:hypothetical protein
VGAYFYNLSEQKMDLIVNGFSGDTIAGLGSAPYAPNASANSPYEQYDTATPEEGQIGTTNTVEYKLTGGAGGTINVTVDIDFGRYPANVDIIFYLFNSAVVVLSPSDSVPYMGTNGTTIQMGPGSQAELK